MENNAGMDVCYLKIEYGDRIVLMGNIAVKAMAGSRAEIEAEVKQKILCAKEGGGVHISFGSFSSSGSEFGKLQICY